MNPLVITESRAQDLSDSYQKITAQYEWYQSVSDLVDYMQSCIHIGYDWDTENSCNKKGENYFHTYDIEGTIDYLRKQNDICPAERSFEVFEGTSKDDQKEDIHDFEGEDKFKVWYFDMKGNVLSMIKRVRKARASLIKLNIEL